MTIVSSSTDELMWGNYGNDFFYKFKNLDEVNTFKVCNFGDFY